MSISKKMEEVLKWLETQLNTFEDEKGRYTYHLEGDIIYQRLSHELYKGDNGLGRKFVWITYDNGNLFLNGSTSQLSKYLYHDGFIPGAPARQPMYDCERLVVMDSYLGGQSINAMLGRQSKMFKTKNGE